VYCHRLISYIGAYIAVLGGVDAITFTAGVGENDALVRAKVVGRLAGIGAILDTQANQSPSREARMISTPDSPITVLVIPTNEELAMARETKAAIS
jgi:acetate kinase